MKKVLKFSSFLLAIIMLFTCTFSSMIVLAEEPGDATVINLKEGCTAFDIQDALNTNRDDSSKPLIVNVPAGTYECDATLFIYSNTTLNSTSDTLYVLNSEKYKVLLGSYNFSGDVGGYNQIKNVTVNGGKFDGGNVGGEIVRFIHASNINVDSIQVFNVGDGGHHFTFAGVNGGTISNCEFYGYNGTQAKEAIHLDIVHDDTMVPGTDNYDDATCQNIEIMNCDFHNVSRGVGSHGMVEGVLFKNINIHNNNFKSISESAIKLCNYKDSKITNNIIDTVGKGIFIHTKLKANADAYYPALETTVKDAVPASDTKYNYNIIVESNTISNASSSKNDGRGIEVCSESSANKIGGVQLKSNTISNSQQYGIFLNQNCFYNTVNNNTINKTGDNGLNIYDSYGNTASSNKVSYAGKYGIALNAKGGNTVKSNTVSKSKDNGILIYKSTKNNVTGNTVSSAGSNGISLSSSASSNTVTSNKITYPVAYGIFLYNASNSNTVKSNTISTPAKNGISLSTKCCSNAIESNTINNSKSCGVQLYNACNSNKVNSNTISAPASHGISVTNSSGSNTMYKNKITKAKGNGININKSTKNAVSTNTIDTCSGMGICVSTSCTSTSIRYNSINNPYKNAIYVNKSNSVQVLSNTVKNCKNTTGISIASSTSPSVTKNKFTYTTKTPIYINGCSKSNTPTMYVTSIYTVNTKSTRVTGKAGKSGSTITVKIGSKSYKATVAKDKKFTSYKIPKQKKGTTITVIEKDKYGNQQTVTRKVS